MHHDLFLTKYKVRKDILH